MLRSYHRVSKHTSVSMPLWLTALAWLAFLGLLGTPAFGLAALFGSTTSTAAMVLEVVWYLLLACGWAAAKAK